MDPVNNSSYYEKLGFKKIDSWSEKDLAQFLFRDYIDDMNKMKFPGTEKFLIRALQESSQKHKKYKIVLNFIDRIYNNFFIINNIFNKRKKRILFIGNKYSSIILAAKKNYEVQIIVAGKKDRLFAIKHLIKYDSYRDLNQLISDCLNKKDESCPHLFADEIKKRIKKINPDYIVIWNDCLPVERATVLASRALGITTLEIQHGRYDSFVDSPLTSGRIADYILVWGKYFRDLYTEKNKNIKNPADIYILGYPYLIKKNRFIKEKNSKYVIYYLGQNYESYKENFLDIKIETIKKINEICNKLGIKFIYRPHPGDDRLLLQKELPEIYFSPKKEKVEDSISKGDVFISINSTLLVEAAMRNKICFQIMNYPIQIDNFEQLGICTKSFDSIKGLENYLTIIKNADNLDEFKIKFNNDYIETKYNPGERFLQILREINNAK